VQREVEQTMPADKLGRYMTSNAFLTRANAAVSKAVRQLEELGMVPAYVQKSSLSEPPRTAAGGHDASAPEKE